jgi:hypothetical protein
MRAHPLNEDDWRLARQIGFELSSPFSGPQSATTSSSVGSNWRCFGRVSRRGAVTGRRPARIGYVSSRHVQEVRQAHLGRLRTSRRGGAPPRTARGPLPVPAQVAPAAPPRSLNASATLLTRAAARPADPRATRGRPAATRPAPPRRRGRPQHPSASQDRPATTRTTDS